MNGCCRLAACCTCTHRQIDASDKLRDTLSVQDPLEGEEELRVRETCIRNLYESIREWIREVCVKQGMSEEDAHEVSVCVA